MLMTLWILYLRKTKQREIREYGDKVKDRCAIPEGFRRGKRIKYS